MKHLSMANIKTLLWVAVYKIEVPVQKLNNPYILLFINKSTQTDSETCRAVAAYTKGVPSNRISDRTNDIVYRLVRERFIRRLGSIGQRESFTSMFFQSSWRCSVCRRKLASRDQPIVTQESTDSLLEVPVLEALQRRHSDARLGCQSGSQIGGLGSGLAPPRSPELRRHSDVSPASLKELEKVSWPLCDVSELCFSNNRASRQ